MEQIHININITLLSVTKLIGGQKIEYSGLLSFNYLPLFPGYCITAFSNNLVAATVRFNCLEFLTTC